MREAKLAKKQTFFNEGDPRLVFLFLCKNFSHKEKEDLFSIGSVWGGAIFIIMATFHAFISIH